jgi:hypothetical protein
LLIIGSTALAYSLFSRSTGNIPDFRSPVDTDILCNEDELQTLLLDVAANDQYHEIKMLSPTHYTIKANKSIFEITVAKKGSSDAAYMQLAKERMLPRERHVYSQLAHYATPDMLYSMKRSHRYYPRNWKKHMEDYHLLKTMVGDADALAEITKQREQETEKRLGKLKTPSLMKSSTEFFNDNVSNKIFIHDEMHEIMAHRERPMFEYFKEPGNTVKCSKAMFFQLTLKERVQAVLEEAYVIALERGIVPMMYDMGRPVLSRDAFEWAVMRIGTTLCSGWFREFAVESYPAVMAMYNPAYVAKFLSAVSEGRIKRIERTIAA